MRVLIFSPYGTNTPHPETDLELAQRHLDAGDHVTLMRCLGDLPACDLAPQPGPAPCLRCVCAHGAGVARLAGNVELVPWGPLTRAETAELGLLPREFRDVASVKEFRFHGQDAGYAALSSLVSLTRNAEPDLRDPQTADLLHRQLKAFCGVFLAVRRYVEAHRPARAYVYNGRFAVLRAFFRACQDAGVPVATHERGADLHRFATFEGAMPHEVQAFQARARAAWEGADARARAVEAARFYEQRAAGRVQSWHSFVAAQQRDALPPQWEAGRHNVVLFTSSEDEFVAIGDAWSNGLYPDQATGIRRLLEAFRAEHPHVHLTVRVHPNAARARPDVHAALAPLAGPQFTLVRADSPVSTYALLGAADVVGTFGSTVGIEAVYWGKPSVLMGPSFYRGLGGVHVAASHENAVALLAARLEPGNREAALIYGHQMATFGEPFLHFRASGVSSGAFRGRVLVDSLACRAAERLVSVRAARGVLRLAQGVARARSGMAD